MSLPYTTVTVLPKRKTAKRIGQHLLTGLLTLSLIAWSIGVPLSIFLPAKVAYAAAPSISSVAWKTGSTAVLVTFDKGVFKNDWASDGDQWPSWGPMGSLEVSDFTLTAATSGATITAVQHEGGSTRAVLTLSAAPVATETIACAASAVWSEGMDNSNTPEACGTTATAFAGGNEDIIGPTSTVTVNLFSNTSFSVRFSEPVAYPSTATSSYWTDRIQLTTADATDPYDGSASVYVQDVASVGDEQNSWGWRDNWMPSEVWFDVWDANIDQAEGTNSLVLLATGDHVITDVFGNALNTGTNVTVSPLEYSTSMGAAGLEAISAYRRSATVVDVVFSNNLEEASAENTAFYTLETAASDTETISSVVLCKTGECTSPTVDSEAVVRITASAAVVASYDFETSDWTTFPDTIRVNGQWDSAGAPKDTSGSMNTADWPIPIETGGDADVDGIGVDGNVIQVMVGDPLDPATVTASAFEFWKSGGAAATGTITTSLSFDNREIFVTIAGDPTVENNDVLRISTTTAAGVKDVFGATLAASTACTTGTANLILCTIDATAPTITKVAYSDVDSSNSFTQNDTIVLSFSKDMDTYSAGSIWDWDLLYGPSCSVAAPTDSRANCSWGWWGDGASVDWSADSDSADPDGSGNATADDMQITIGNWADIGEGYIISPWWDSTGHGGVRDSAGNGISNVGLISSSAGSISSVQHTDAGTAGLDAGDTVAITFSKRMMTSTVTAANASSTLPVSGRTNLYGDSPTLSWASDELSVTITLGANFTLADGDAIDPASSVTDINGNAVTGTVTFRDSSTGGGGLSLNLSKARYKLYLEFPEPIVDQSYMAYPAETGWASQPIGNTYKSSTPQLAATDFAFTDASGESLDVSRINFISRDGKKVILQMSSAIDPILAADSLNAGALVGGDSYGVFTGVNNTFTNLSTTLTDTTGPTISFVNVGGGGGFGSTAGSSSIGPGTSVTIQFSEPIDPGSFFDHSASPPTWDLDTVLALPSSHTWGSGAEAYLWSSSTTDFEAMPDIIEITLGQGVTFANGDTITPSGVTDIVGNAATGTYTFDSSLPAITSVVSDLSQGASSTIFDAGDTVTIVFNTEMDAGIATTTLDGVLDNAFFVDSCGSSGCTTKTWGTSPEVRRRTTTKTNDTYLITVGTSPTLADGDRIWPEQMYIFTAGGRSIWDPGTIDISAPTLTKIDVDSGANTTIDVADVIYFRFSEEMDQTTITNDGGANDIITVLPPSAGDYGATPTLSWTGPGILQVTIANTPTTAIDTASTPTVTPTTAITDVGGTAIESGHSAISMEAFAVSPPTSVTFTDPDTSSMGIDKADIQVTWTASASGTVDHYNVYLLPATVGLNIQTGTDQFVTDSDTSTHRPLNASGITTTSFVASTDTTYEIMDDSRYEYVAAGTPPASGANFFPLMSDVSYIAYVVACVNTDCSSSSMAGASSSFNFTSEGFQQMYGGGAGQTTFVTGMAIAAGGTGGSFAMGGGTPWVEGSIPFGGQTGVAINTQLIGAKFSEPLDETTITSSTFIVEKVSDSTDVTGTLTYDDGKNAVTFKPAANLTASTQYQIRITTGVQSTFGAALGSEYYSTFTTGTGVDSTAPSVLDNKFQIEGTDSTAVSPYIPEIGVRFTEDMNPTSLSSNSVKLYQSTGCTGTTVSGSVDYDPWDKALHFWLNTSLAASTGHCLKVSGTLVKDAAGNAIGSDYTIIFTTRAATSADTANPNINWADADNFHIGMGFDKPMKESTVTDSSNWTLESPTGTVVQLTGAQFFYDTFMNELHMDGFQLTDGNTFTITANNNVKGLNGNELDSTTKSKSGTVHGMTGPGILNCGMGGETGEFAFGCNMDNPMDANVMMFMPINVWPMDMTADVTTDYFIDVPISQAIDSGGQIVLQFPAGFDVKGAATLSGGMSFMNNDLNGPGSGVVTISDVTAIPMDQKIKVTLAISGATATGSNDFLSFDLTGIKNTATPATMDFTKATAGAGMGGYQVTISTKDSTGKTLESNLKSMPFPIEAGGNGRITVTVKEEGGTTNITGTARVMLDGSRGGHREATVSATENGKVVFRNLQTSSGGVDYWIWVEPPKGQGYFSGGDMSVRLTDSSTTATKTINLKKGSSTITATITHSTALAGEVVVIDAWGNDGWTDATTTLDASGTTTATLNVKDGDWNVGLHPYFGDMMMMMGPMPSMAFMPPPPKFITVKGSASVSISLTVIGTTDRVTGYVYDESGNGLPDVDVWAHDPSGMFGGGDFVRTDPNGAYSLRLPAGDYKIGAGMPGLGHTAERLITSPSSGNNFTLTKGVGSVKGYVLDADDSPLGGAVVIAQNTTTKEVRDAKADSKTGAYTFFFPAGTWTLTAKHPSYSKIKTDEGTPAASYSVTVTSTTDESGKNFKISGTYYTISGYICAVAGASGCSSGEVEGAVVWAEEVTTATGALTGEGASESTGSDGYYTLNLPASTSGTTHYNLYAKTPKGGKLRSFEGDPAGSLARKGIDLSSANATKNWAIKTPVPVDIIISNIQSTSNNSAGTVSEIYLNVYDSATGYESGTYKQNATSSTIELLQKPSSSDGYVVKLAVPGFGELDPDSSVTDSGGLFDVGASAAATNDLVFTLPSTSITISGSVTSGANTWVYVYDKSSGIEHGVLADSNGDFSLEVAAGTYNLKAEKKGYKGYKHATEISTDTTGLSLSLPAVTTSIAGTAYESDGSTAVADGYVSAKEHGGTGTAGAQIEDGTFTLEVDASSEWNIFVSSETGYETMETGVAAGASESFTLATAIPGYEEVLEDPDSVSPGKGGSVTDAIVTNTTTTDIDIEFMPNSLSGSDELNVSVDNLAGTHETTEHKVVGSEKSVDIERGRVSDLEKPTEVSMEWSKAEVQELLENDSDIATTTLSTLFNATNIGHFEENIGNDGEWVGEPTIARAMIKNGSASTTFGYEDFSTFVTNVTASSSIYDDYKVEFKTMATKMSIRGTTNPGLSDETAPYVNNGNAIAAPTAVSTASAITLDWSSLTESCASGTCLELTSQSGMLEYNIYRALSSFSGLSGSDTDDPADVTGVTQTNASQVAAGTQTFTDSGLTSNTTYYYVITAVDLKGNGDEWQYISTEVQIVTASGGAGGGAGGGVPAPVEEVLVVTPADEEVTTEVTVSAHTEGTLIRGAGGEKVYVIKNGKKLWVPTASAFNAAGYKWADIQEVSASEVAETISGQLIREEGKSEVYVIKGNRKRHLPSAEAFVNEGYNWDDITVVGAEHGAGFKTANLLRAAGDIKVYIVEKGLKRHIPNPASFNSYSYDWNDVLEVTATEIGGYVAANLMRAMDDYKVYLLEGATRKWIETAEIFNSYGYDWNKVLDVSSVELESYSAGAAVTEAKTTLLHKVFDFGERMLSIF